MLQIFSINEQNLAPLEHHSSSTEYLADIYTQSADSPAKYWVNLSDPTSQELLEVSEQLHIPLDFLTDSLDPAERAHVLRLNQLTLLVIRVSQELCDGNALRYSTLPLGIIITPNAVVSVCKGSDTAFKLINGKLPQGDIRNRLRVAFTLIQQASIQYINRLEKIDALTEELEKSMRGTARNEDLSRMMQLEKSLVYFLTALKANTAVIDKMLTSGLFKWEKSEEELLIDALTESKQAAEMAEIYTQITANMSDTFSAMISNNMNSAMKFLTAVTLILMAPSIVVGLYGMNIPLPFQESRFALPLIIIGTVAICAGLWRYLQKRHWM